MAVSGVDDDFAGTVGEIVAHLEHDPVLVEEVMGNGHTEAVLDALTAKAAKSSVPVHIVLTKAPPGLTTDNTAEELLTLLHARSGEDGVWFVSTSEVGHTALAVYGDIAPSVDNDELMLAGAVREAREAATDAIRDSCGDCFATPVVEAGLVLDVVNAGLPGTYMENPLTDQQIEAYATSTWQGQGTRSPVGENAEMPTPGLYAVVATVTALCVAVVGYRLVQAVGGVAHRPGSGKGTSASSRKPRPAPDPAKELDRARARASSATKKLSAALGRADDLVDWRRRDTAAACLERAETRTSSDGLLEVVGSLVLAQTGLHALETSEGQYRCCYVDPRHGAADTESPLGGGASVPVCRACAGALEKGAELAPLHEKGRLGNRRPYYEGSTVWARTGFGALGGDWWQQVPR
ncbi:MULTISPECIES: hypothetical protein [unclassified Nocardioides]|uniref:hypothetical protein n=1 Tax=unclassified Nocardioides TaxID=2615069 RepID=UPI0006F58535|nr:MULTISPECIES: hypothetical protein [unclassified Nocardioides]KQY56514.1 hypothetical protein ASD30_09260 [Nocardioides sp. Root140]KQZ75270.1 hypothetical protein ASD66_02570 [Nocardioides sp. Root151]KRF14350.1 hypothetical protein ASH02_08365 [Nocardioides sp. Soil796]